MMLENIYSYSAGINFSRQNPRQILTPKVDPRNVGLRVKLFLMAVNP